MRQVYKISQKETLAKTCCLSVFLYLVQWSSQSKSLSQSTCLGVHNHDYLHTNNASHYTAKAHSFRHLYMLVNNLLTMLPTLSSLEICSALSGMETGSLHKKEKEKGSFVWNYSGYSTKRSEPCSSFPSFC